MTSVSEICQDMVRVSLPNQSKDTNRADAVKIPVQRRVKKIWMEHQSITNTSASAHVGKAVTSTVGLR